MLNLENARKVDFRYWNAAREEEAPWLAAQATTHNCIAEIGACVGCTTRVLADNTYGRVTSVDNWTGGTDDALTNGVKSDFGGWDGTYAEFKKNTADLTNLRVIKNDSVSAATDLLFEGARFDMIFIDASHDYENVAKDILAWRRLLSDGGLLCGHDFDEQTFPGVVQAVKDYVPNWRRSRAGSIWIAV